MFGIMPVGPWEIVLILAIVLIIFGPGKLPQAAKMFGKSIKEFKGAVNDQEDTKQS
ncbi:Sec-independent protein translocase subunit TatA/TatB [Desulfitibacter alkalitolerans]|uniref:Sec-independent protein translocase subunit TatA/TatB n=1 Tax=Desulfitibacter alkalitolerans TaxID=264641 RepID=UPI0005529721|nr:twin-arginine translocase TatA/TatE family subunit [Desulfitibacter alkalitolerans]